MISAAHSKGVNNMATYLQEIEEDKRQFLLENSGIEGLALAYVGTVNKAVIDAYVRTGIPEDELRGEAWLVYCKAYRGFNPRRGTKFNTYLMAALYKGLANFAARYRYHDDLFSLEYAETKPSRHHMLIEEAIYFSQVIRGLSNEAQAVVDILLSCPGELAAMAKNDTPKAIRGALYRYLRALGWTWPRIWGAFKEVRAAVAAL
jgi:hypothetical protein